MISIRILGKTALAQLTPHDFGALFFLAYMLFGAIDIENYNQVVAGIVSIVIINLLLSKLSLFHKFFSTLFIGKPTILVKDGKIVTENLKRSSYNLMELLSNIRTAGYFDINDIDYVILEPNGKISVFPKKKFTHVTPNDLNIGVKDTGLPVPVIIDGQIQHDNLQSLNLSEQWLKDEIYAKDYKEIRKILLATVRDKNHLVEIFSSY